MFGKLITFPFRALWSIVKTIARIGTWLLTTVPGLVILAAAGFFLGRKYLDRHLSRNGPRP